MSAEEQLTKLDLILPRCSAPAANYSNSIRSGSLLFLSGKAPLPIESKLPRGRIGAEFTLEEGYQLARSAGLDLLAVIRQELGSLDHVAQVVEIQGFLNTTPNFEDHPKVLDGCSDLMVQVFGQKGSHARSVLGASSLRSGAPLVLKAIVEVAETAR